MKNNTTYNGHKNWNHWNVSLWLFNDPNLYSIMVFAVNDSDTRNEAARFILSSMLNHFEDGKTLDGAPFTFTSIRAAITSWEF